MTAATVVIVNYRKRDLLGECLAALPEAAGAELAERVETIVIDNGSDDGSVELVRSEHPSVTLVALDHNEGFAPGVVRGAALAAGEWLVLVNNDAMLMPGALAALLAAGESDPRVGIVTAQVRFADRRDQINTAGLEIDNLGVAYDRLAGVSVEDPRVSEPAEVFGASGCVTAYRMRMLSEIGGFDGSFFAYLEDADLAWRARVAGWRCLYEPRAVVYHHGSATLGDGSKFKYELVGRNRVRMLAKNATDAQLRRWGWAMLLYDLAYVTFVALTDRTLAPLRGRVQGLRQWRAYRRAGAPYRGPVALAGAMGWLGALRMRSAYRPSR